MTIAKNTYSAEMIYYNSTNGAQQKIEYTDNYLNISAYGNTPSGGALRLNSNRDIWITAETAIGGDNSIKMRGYTVSSWVGDGGFVIRNTDGVAKHVFTSLGGKPAGGSIEIDGRTLGMSPTDSPQVLIEYVDFDVHLTTSGTKVYLDPTYLKAIGNRFAAFSSNGKIIEKGLDYIVISGEGMADIRYVGERIGEEGRFFCDITNV